MLTLMLAGYHLTSNSLLQLPTTGMLALTLYSSHTDCIENSASNNSSIVMCISVAVETCLPSCYHATDNLFKSQHCIYLNGRQL
jgi:hypothetical protein